MLLTSPSPSPSSPPRRSGPIDFADVAARIAVRFTTTSAMRRWDRIRLNVASSFIAERRIVRPVRLVRRSPWVGAAVPGVTVMRTNRGRLHETGRGHLGEPCSRPRFTGIGCRCSIIDQLVPDEMEAHLGTLGSIHIATV